MTAHLPRQEVPSPHGGGRKRGRRSRAVVAYAWSSFFLTPIAGTTDPVVARVGNVVHTLIAVAILVLAARRLRGNTTPRS
ncbi:hypothetical protein [Streptosporangium sp. V21-05]|uniref:hypothetical protein n=1 Tax=Streptosporangium sp. V21-05 TaxID=3446115 RepID=UPI003F53876F